MKKSINKVEIEDYKSTLKSPDISQLIYIIRNQQVMIDSDLAALYHVETKHLNESVRRNMKRFPDKFCFQLTEDETDILRSQFATASIHPISEKRRFLPYVFTEEGIAMLSAVLHSEEAIRVSIGIMESFIEMRHFAVNNQIMLERINSLEFKQIAYQEENDKRFDEIFTYISNHKESSQRIFFAGQIYDANSLITELIMKANKDIILIDGYIDTKTLDLLSKKKNGVNVQIYSFLRGDKLTNTDVSSFNKQYPSLNIKHINTFHDRFLIIDHAIGYHIGASIKDAGKKCFAITKLEDEKIISSILNNL